MTRGILTFNKLALKPEYIKYYQFIPNASLSTLVQYSIIVGTKLLLALLVGKTDSVHGGRLGAGGKVAAWEEGESEGEKDHV